MKDTALNTPEFQRLSEAFDREMLKENRSKMCREIDSSYLKEFLRYMEDRGIVAVMRISQGDVDAYVKYLEQRPNERRGGTLSEHSIKKHRGAIHSFFKFLNAEQIPAQPIHIRRNRRGERKTPAVLTQREVEWLYSVTDETALGKRDRAMLGLYYGCGLRKNEALKLYVTDIDFQRGRIYIRAPKSKKDRYVMMSPSVKKHLEDYVFSAREMYLPQNSPYEELLIGARSKPVAQETLVKRLESLWNKVKERYNIEKHISLHTLRHSLGTHLYMGGMDIEMIALMLGHQSLETTQLYVHLSNLNKA